MALIRLQNVSKQLGDRVILDGLSLELYPNQTVGLIGPNGAGKTTIFRTILGALPPDSGTVTSARGLAIGYLPQEPLIAEGQTLHDEVLSALAEVLALERKQLRLSEQMAQPENHDRLPDLMAEYDRATARFEAAGGYRYEQRLAEILGGLGFRENEFALPMKVLSGGQKCRAALAKLLLQESQFLLLDEPTNHLDIDAVRWLEKFLAGHKGGAVIVSHDRYLLDRLADRIVELDNGRITSYPGNYSNYVKTREVRRLTQARQYEQDQAFIRKEREFIARHMGSQRTAEARGRRTRLERRLTEGEFTLARPGERDKLSIRFDDAATGPRAGRPVLEISELAKAYGETRLFSNLSFELELGQRLGITGPNGTGKTTLLRVLLGQVEPDAGTFQFAPQAAIGYFAQDAGELEPEYTVVQEILAARPEMLESQARNIAARFLFRGDDPFKRVGQLSGGEQSRVRLMKLVLASPNVLVLDEPTNHLDVPSREILEETLEDFPGTVIAVSHDRYFLDRICDRLLVMRPGRHQLYRGNYTYYIEQIEAAQAAAAAAEEAAAPKRKRPAARATDKKPPAPRSRFSRLKLPELEEHIMTLETRLAEIEVRFGDQQIYQDPDGVAKLRVAFEAAQTELAEAQAEWDQRAEAEADLG